MKKFLAVALLIAAAALGWKFGLPAYRQWRHDRLIRIAEESFQKGDVQAAALSARQALNQQNRSAPAARIMARINDRVHSPAALDWWQRVLDIEPQPASNHLDLARCAVVNGNYILALSTLHAVAETSQSNPEFHRLAAMASIGNNNIAVAEAHFAAAAKLDPSEKSSVLNLAILRSQATNQAVAAAALRTLEQLYNDPVFSKDALRHLTMAATRNGDFARAVSFSQALAAQTNAAIEDSLLHLGALKDALDGGFPPFLAQLQSANATNASAINTLCIWLANHQLADDALAWIESLPKPMQDERAVRVARADAFAAKKNWSGLQDALQGADWKDMEFLRHAMVARACRELRQDFASQAEWRASVIAASGGNGHQILTLYRLATAWGWEDEREEMLWAIVRTFPAERWALQTLNQLYTAGGNTRGLQKLYQHAYEKNPEDIVAKNNFASVSFLLNTQIELAHRFAIEARTRYPNNEAFAATFAYSLHLRGKTHEALDPFDALKPEQLDQPGVALYYGIILAADGQAARAAKYLELAEAGQLLPEEQSLLTEAKKAR